MDPVRGLRLFQAHRQVQSSLVFIITRSCDARQYAYYAVREGNELVREKLDCKMVECDDWKTHEALHPILLQNFFGASISRIGDSSKYNCRLAGFPERNMVLHQKKNSSPTITDGHVTSVCTFELEPGVRIQDVQLYNIYLDMTFNDLNIPDVKMVQVQGIAHLSQTKHLSKTQFQLYCMPMDENKVYVIETIPVTPELKKRFDVAALAKGFFASTFLPPALQGADNASK